MADKKNTTSTTPAPKKQRKVRTLEERIAELKAQAEAKAAKDRKRAELEYSEVVGKFTRAVGQAQKFAGQIEELARKHGFELPEGLNLEPAADVTEETTASVEG